MSGFKSDLLHELSTRGFIHQVTDADGLDALAAKETVTGYIGFDCTAESLHIGNLVQIMMLRTMQRTGHRPIALIGGGTSKVGDPSGKDEARQLLDADALAVNAAGVKRSLDGLLSFGDGPGQAMLIDNAAWLDQLRYIPFLREVGRHFTVNRMLTFDSVRLRLEREQPLTFLEFNYMVMQAYDFMELARRHGCRLQMGGSDQWGNIVSGVDLARRIDGAELYGLTTPLITTASGAKMGKTAQGAVWLNADRLSTFDYWQFWRNTEDGDVGRFLNLFTDLPLAEIGRLTALGDSEINEAKIVLATEATKLCHGAEAAEAARAAAASLYAGAAADGATGLPQVEVEAAAVGDGIAVFELFRLAGLAATNGEARRLIRGGGARLDGTPVADETEIVAPERLIPGPLKLSAGRKRHVLVRAAP